MGFESFLLFFYLTSLSLLSLVGVPMPFSVPPLPEEPALLRMAPKDSLCCFAWSGAAAPDAKSSNVTERLCAEPEVRALVEALRGGVAGVMRDELGAAAGIAQRSFEFACSALQQPGCLFLRTVARTPKPVLEAGLALKLGDQMVGARTLLGAYGLAMRGLAKGEQHEDVEVDGVRFVALPTDVEHTFLGWAEVDGWLLVAAGRDVPAGMVAGLRGTAQGLLDNADYRDLVPACQVSRPASRTFVDVARLQGTLGDLLGPTATAILEVFGLQRARAALSVAGFEGDGFCSRTRVAAPHKDGLLGAFGGAPLGQDLLLAVPVDADLALALRTEPQLLEQSILRLFTAVFGERCATGYEEFQREFEQQVGLDWRKLVANLDGQAAAWNSPGQGGIGFTAAAATVGMRDAAAFGEALRTLNEHIGKHVPSKADARARGERIRRRDGFLETFAHEDHTVHWIDSSDADFPMAPSWCAAASTLVFGLTPQSLRSTLDALDAPNPDRSLARLPAINKRGKATLLVHIDMGSLLHRCYPWLCMLLQSQAHEWQSEGFDFDAADLPRLESLRHVGRELSRLEPDAAGFTFTRTGTLPLLDPLTVAAVGVLGFALADSM